MILQSFIQKHLKKKTRLIATCVAFMLPTLTTPVLAQQVTMETLLDRIQIEDFLIRYYYDLSIGKAHELSDYFTEDALLDVDGTIAHGHDEIDALYGPDGDSEDESGEKVMPINRVHMLLTNPVIEVNGDRAIAHVIWTGVINQGVGTAPSLYEQGREDTELVKINDKWLIKQRYISSDSGIPDRFDETYVPRDNPLDISP